METEEGKTQTEILKKADFSDIFGSLKTKVKGQEFKDEVKKGWK